MRSHIIIIAASLAALCWAADPTVTILAGTVIGTATGVSNQPGNTGLANAYFGVPFAQKPTGSLRFAPPQPAGSLRSPLIAKTRPPVCLQKVSGRKKAYFNNPISNPDPPETVLFWLFGGDFDLGGASLNMYDGTSFAINQDVVVVVPNYRTNIFGFSGSPQIQYGKQNVGLLDQQRALDWVQINIAAFGGDPKKVTLFGESAGGFSVKQLLALPYRNPLPFRAAIIESEAATETGNATQSYQRVVNNFGCGSAASQIQCLRGVSATVIQDYITKQDLSFNPVVGDGTNLAFNTKSAIDKGTFAALPIMIGNNKDEGTIYMDLLSSSIVPGGPVNINATLSILLYPGIVQYTQALYNLIYSPTMGNYSITNKILTDFIHTCPTSILANYLAGKKRQPVWRYRYDPGFPNVSYKTYFSSYHTSEIPQVWGTYPTSNQYGNVTQQQIAMSAYMQKAWANFAKDPTAGPGWPAVGTNRGLDLAILGGSNNTNGQYMTWQAEADQLCGILNPIITGFNGGY